MKKLAIVVSIFFCTCHGMAQTPAKPPAQDPPSQPPVERVEGIVAVTGYFGSKLLGELKSRFNLADDPQPTQPTKVIVKVGSISFERTEQRPVKEG